MNYNIFGGKVIDSGGYGCIFKPSITCKNSNKTKKNIVSKLLPSELAIKEHSKNTLIKKKIKSIPNWKHFFIFSIVSCTPKKLSKKDLKNYTKRCKILNSKKFTKKNINSKINKLKILQIPYGGYTLETVIMNNIKDNYSLFSIINNKLIILLNKAIVPMNKLKIFHFDIKDTNILIGHKYNIKIIDWGLSSIITNNIPSYLYDKALQFNYPFSSILINTDLVNNINDYLNTNNKDINELSIFIRSYYETKITGVGHIDYLNEIFSNFINNDKSVYDIVFNYCANVVINNIDKSGNFNIDKYFFNIFIKNVDIWGFVSVYMSFLLIKDDKLKKLKNDIENIIFKHLFNSYGIINISQLISDLKLLKLL